MERQPIELHQLEPKENKSPSKEKGFFSKTLTHTINLYKRYPETFIFTILFIIGIITLIYFSKLSFLIIFLIINETYTFIEKKTAVTLGLEHATIVSILAGYYFGILFGLFASLVIQIILQLRNNKIAVIGVIIDGAIWFTLVIVAAIFNQSNLVVIAAALTISRYIVKQIANISLGYQIHDALKDVINPIYHIFFIQYLVPFLSLLWL